MQVSNFCHESMEIRTKNFRAGFEAGFEAGLESLKSVEIEENNMTKKGLFFGAQNVRKSRRAKWASPVEPCVVWTRCLETRSSPRPHGHSP